MSELGNPYSPVIERSGSNKVRTQRIRLSRAIVVLFFGWPVSFAFAVLSAMVAVHLFSPLDNPSGYYLLLVVGAIGGIPFALFLLFALWVPICHRTSHRLSFLVLAVASSCLVVSSLTIAVSFAIGLGRFNVLFELFVCVNYLLCIPLMVCAIFTTVFCISNGIETSRALSKTTDGNSARNRSG